MGSRIEWGSDVFEQTTDDTIHRPVLEIATIQPIAITHHGVRERLNKRNSSIPTERVAALMIYGFEADRASDAMFEPLPPAIVELPIGIGDFVQSWVSKQYDGMKEIIRDQKHALRWHNEDVATARLHERFEWAANIVQIHAMQRLHEETLLARTGVELILLDALNK